MSIFILYALLFIIFAPLTAAAIQFTTCARGLVCEGGAFRNPMMDMRPLSFSTGRVSYSQAVPLRDAETGEVASFTTSFSLSIYAADDDTRVLGDGVAFFLGHYPSSIPTNSWGGNLGLMDLNNNMNVLGDSRIVAVEVNKVVLSWTFSSTLATTTHKRRTSPTHKLLAAAILPPAVFVLCLLLGFVLWRWRQTIKTARRRTRPSVVDKDAGEADEEEDEEKAEFVRGMGPKRYGYRRLAAATGNFAEGNKLGQGGFGSVYKGELADQDVLVAVKVLSPESSGQGRKEFEAEVKIISQLRHRNLVRLLGWCDSC